MLKERDGVIKTTPKERGYKLPIGVVGNDGKLHKNFSIGELYFKEEQAIGEFRARNPNSVSTYIVSKVVALLLKNVGPIEYNHTAEEKDLEKEVTALMQIGTMNYPDVYYIYLMARINELGSSYRLPFPCTNNKCEYSREPGVLTADLNEVDVFCVEDTSLLSQEVSLIKGIKYKGEIKKKVTVQPMLWMYMIGDDMHETEASPTLLQNHFIRKCVVGVEGVEGSIHLTDEQLASLRKTDIERIGTAIHELSLGPTFILRGECPKCKYPFIYPVDTDYSNFFSDSSL